MPQSLSDTITLIASVTTLIGSVIAIGGAIFTWQAGPGAALAPTRSGHQAPPPRSPAYGPARRAAGSAPAQRARRGVSHPVILGFTAAGLLVVTLYSLESLINYEQSGGVSTGLLAGSPLIGANALLVLVNLVSVVVVTVGMAVTAYRAQNWAWLTAGVIALVVSLCTVGVFSAVAFVPGVFYGLFGPREQSVWGV